MCNQVERLQAFAVLFQLCWAGRFGGPKNRVQFSIVPVVLLGEERKLNQEEVANAGLEGLALRWNTEADGPLTQWKIANFVVVPVCDERVVGSGPADVTEYRLTRSYDPSCN